jgi:GH25 family lysozyme M1 (1,4-beta-N-acetylmuramidase)
MIEYIEDETNVTPIIYTSLHFWNKYILPNYKGDLTLWIADYRNQGPPDAKWSIWQYTCKGKVSGIKPPVDMNICVQIDTLLVK